MLETLQKGGPAPSTTSSREADTAATEPKDGGAGDADGECGGRGIKGLWKIRAESICKLFQRLSRII